MRVLELDACAGVFVAIGGVEQLEPAVLFFAGTNLPQRLEADGAGDEFLNVVELGREAVTLRDSPFFVYLGQCKSGVVVRDGDRGDLCRVEVGDDCFANSGLVTRVAAQRFVGGEVGDAAQ